MKNLTLDEFKKIHEDWKSTGLSIRDYCSNTGFEESKFYYWRKKLTDSMLPRKHPIKYPFSLLYFHCTFAFAILHELLTYFHYDTRTI